MSILNNYLSKLVVYLMAFRGISLVGGLVVIIVGAHFALGAIVRGEQSVVSAAQTQEQFEAVQNLDDVNIANSVDSTERMQVEMMMVGDGANQSKSVQVRAQVVKKNVVTIVAQTAGVVRSVDVSAGDSVWVGRRLVRLGDTYIGGSVADVNAWLTAQIAQTQSEITHKTGRNIDILRKNLNQTNRDSVSMARRDLSVSKRTTQIAQFQVDANRSRAQIGANLMRPAAPIGGVVEQVLVRVGQMVSPGTPLMVIGGGKVDTQLEIGLTQSLASRIDIAQPVSIDVGGEKHFAQITYIAKESVSGVYLAVVKIVDKKLIAQIGDGDFVDVVIGIESSEFSADEVQMIPLDAVRINGGEAVVFVNDNGEARAQGVQIKEVAGGLVIVSGLVNGTQIILNRNVISGQRIR